MILFLTATAGVFGLLVGSFLNVCIFRLPRDCMSIVRPRSRCTRCLRPVTALENIPVISWVVLRGKCRGCGKSISVRYPLVELLTGVLFSWIAFRRLVEPESASPAIASAFFVIEAYLIGAMIVCTFIDLDFTILPDEVTISGAVIGVVAGAILPEWHAIGGRMLPDAELIGSLHVRGMIAASVGAAVGSGTIWTVGIIGKIVFRKEAMGFGDVKYMAFLGAFLGWKGVLLGMLVACFLGALFGVGKWVVVRRMGYVPFGPFLAGGAVAMIFFSPGVLAVLDWYLGLFRPVVEG